MSETNTNQNSWPAEQKRMDPSTDPVEQAHNNMKMLVDKVSGKTLEELSALRDQLDNLMIAIRNRDEILKNLIVQHTEFSANAIRTKQIIAESIEAIHNDFNGKNNPVLTVQK